MAILGLIGILIALGIEVSLFWGAVIWIWDWNPLLIIIPGVLIAVGLLIGIAKKGLLGGLMIVALLLAVVAILTHLFTGVLQAMFPDLWLSSKDITRIIALYLAFGVFSLVMKLIDKVWP